MKSWRENLTFRIFLRNFSCWLQLITGLFFMSFGMTMMVKADIGMSPWGVLHLGTSGQLNIPFGFTTQVVGFLVIVIAYFIGKVKPTAGTIVNMILIGFFIDYIWYPLIPFINVFWEQIVVSLIGIIISGIGTAVYLSADLGAGPRDSLMMALYLMINKSIRFVRTSLEITVLIMGFLLGGKVGIGTLLFALLFGATLQSSLRLLKLFPGNLIKVDILKQKKIKDLPLKSDV